MSAAVWVLLGMQTMMPMKPFPSRSECNAERERIIRERGATAEEMHCVKDEPAGQVQVGPAWDGPVPPGATRMKP